MNWFVGLRDTWQNLLVIIAALIIGLGGGTILIDFMRMPDAVALNAQSIDANTRRIAAWERQQQVWRDSVIDMMYSIEAGLIVHICQTNGSHSGNLPACLAETRLQVRQLGERSR
jgi:hypothetical protein